MAQTGRHVVPCEGAQVAPIQDAFRLAAEVLKAHSDVKTLTLVIPTLDNLDERTSLGQVLGSTRAKRFKKDRTIRFTESCVLELRTLRDLRRSGPVTAVLAVYFDSDMLDEVDALPQLRFVIVVPWTNAGVAEWIRTWDPTVHGSATAVAAPPLASSPVVASALRHLTQIVNVSTGISHPSDREATEALFWYLRKAGEWAPLEEMRRWLVRNGWKPGDADEVVAVAEKTESRRSPPKSAARYFSREAVDRFRAEASDRSNDDEPGMKTS